MAYIYDLTDTWNAGGTTFNAIKMNVTDSASASGSKLVTLQTNGTEHFSVTKAGVGYFGGNVGIGTTSPAAYSGFTVLDVDNGTNGGLVNIKKAGTTIGYINGSSGMLLLANNTPLTLTATGANQVKFVTNGSERARIDASGNVGIGTAAPGAPLEVFSTADEILRLTSTGSPYASWYAGATRRGYIQAQAGAFNIASDTAIPLILATNTTERMRITSAGDVGIGTSSPGSKLHVAGGNVYITGSGAYTEPAAVAGVLAFDSTSGDLNISARSNGGNTFTRFFTSSGGNGAERMRIDSSGNLLVGTTSIPTTSGWSAQMYGGGTYTRTAHNTSAVSGDAFSQFYRDAVEIGSITQNGTTGVLYNTSSDVRLKENIADAEDASSLIDAIQVRKFDWKSGGEHQRYGFIAQELIEVAPEAVSVPADPDAMMGVDYSKLVPMLVKEIQSLRARVAQLEGN